jgi:hypothetical protein
MRVGSSGRYFAAVAAFSVLAAALAGAGLWTAGRTSLWTSVLAGYATALVLVLPTYRALSWSLHKSNRVFYTVFVAGALFRAAGFAAAAVLGFLWNVPSWPAFMLSAAGGLAALSCLELFFLQRGTSV